MNLRNPSILRVRLVSSQTSDRRELRDEAPVLRSLPGLPDGVAGAWRRA
jgi:hypothetical protein